MQPHQPQLFETTRERDTQIQRIDRQNQAAARIILEDARYRGGLMEEWARSIIAGRSTGIYGILPGPYARTTERTA